MKNDTDVVALRQPELLEDPLTEIARHSSGQLYEYFLDHHSGEMGTRVLAEAQQVVNQFLKPTDAPIKGQSHNPSLIRRNHL